MTANIRGSASEVDHRPGTLRGTFVAPPACPSKGLMVTTFKISSFCTCGDCVEVGTSPDGSVIVRDSKDDERSVSLAFTREEWIAFVRGVKAGEFDPA